MKPEQEPSASELAYRATIAELAPLIHVWEGILETHARTPDGYCGSPVCRAGGTGRPLFSYPCPTRVAALYARSMHRGEA